MTPEELAITIDREVRIAMAAEGIDPPTEALKADGTFYRYSSNGRYDLNCWYKLHADHMPAGSFGDFAQNLSRNWRLNSAPKMTTEERATFKAHIATLRHEREAAERERHEEAAAYAAELLAAATPADLSHPYLRDKHIRPPDGVFVDRHGHLLIPIYRHKNGALVLSSLEYITKDGGKKYLFKGLKHAGLFPLGDIEHAPVVCLGEGLATCQSIHQATGLPVIVAFDAGNVGPVAEIFHQLYPNTQLCICGDEDLHADPKKENTGRVAATKAAVAVQGALAMPALQGKKCDWNDVYRLSGPEAVRAGIEQALHPPCVLDQVHAYTGRFVSYPDEHAHIAHTLWIGHTHFMDKWDSTPRLAALSPEPESGKTRVLEVSEPLVPNPIETMNVSTPYLLRKISMTDDPPTLLFDEVDTVFGNNKENEELRGLLNAGHRKGATAGRCVVRNKNVEPEEFPAYCAVAMAGLGDLPWTILTRTIPIHMRRRAPGEHVEPFRRRIHQPQGHLIRDELAVWAAKVGPTLNACPELPPEVTDRKADVWEPLIAVADAAGGPWPKRARVAAVAHVALLREGVPASSGVRLLADIQNIFGQRESLTTEDLLIELIELDESPWGDLKGKPLDSRKLAGFLKPYGIASKNVRVGKDVKRGYSRDLFHDAWTRYLTVPQTDSLNEHYIYKEENIGDPSSSATPATDRDPSRQSATSTTSATSDPSEPDELVFHVAGASPLLPGVSAPTRAAKPAIQGPAMNEEVYRNCVEWITERQLIADRRDANTSLRIEDGQPVWTENPILRKWRFCNVERKKDKVSEWIIRNIMGQFADDPLLFVQLSIGRWLNWPPTVLALIKDKVWPASAWVREGPNWTGMADVVDAFMAREGKAWNAAYRIPSVHGLSRARSVFCRFLGPQLMAQLDAIRMALASGRQQAVHHVLTKLNGWGGNGFLAAQVIVDCTYCDLLPNPKDRDTWAAAGPGCIEGLNRLYNRPVKDKVLERRPEQAMAEMLRLRDRLIQDRVSIIERVSLMDIQNVNCELSKYTRVKNGEGEPRQQYQPFSFDDIVKEDLP
jgi:phage/plasmid primase-like uncharacterized protein